MTESDDCPLRVDTDQKGAAVGVEEAGNGLHDGVLHRLRSELLVEKMCRSGC